MKYFDKNRVEIKAGMTLLMSDGTAELVYDTNNSDGNPDLGINASNEDFLRNHPNADREYYSLGGIDIRNAEVRMEGHRQRLIESGLLHPLSNEEIARRNGILQRIAERRAQGDKCKGVDIPEYCVFRTDKHNCHIQLSSDRCCKDAELVADKLFYYEASRICHHLGIYDTEQPPRPLKGLPPLEMYRICSRAEWDEWVAHRAQKTE